MHVAVCIVAFHNAADVAHCLVELARSQHTDFEVVVCENGGPEAFAKLKTAIPDALPGGQTVRAVLAAGNLGYAGGVNLCLETAPEADAWWVLNPDTAPDPGALAALVERLGRGDCDAVGCTLRLPSGVIQSHGGHWRRLLARAVSIGHSTPWAAPVDAAEIERRQNYLNGAAMLMSRRFVEVAGPMREDYFLYCEEVEWCLRGLQKGLKLGFAPKAIVLHYQGTTTGNPPDIHQRGRTPVYLNERNKILLTRDLFPWLTLPAAAFALALLFLKFGGRRAWKQLGYALDGWAAGLAGRRGPPDWIG